MYSIKDQLIQFNPYFSGSGSTGTNLSLAGILVNLDNIFNKRPINSV